MKHQSIIGGLMAALMLSGSPQAYPQPAFAGPAYASVPAVLPAPSGDGLVDKIRDAVRGGLIHLAVAFTNAGAAIVTNRMIQAGTAPKNIGWGTDSTAAVVGNTALGAEVAPTTAGGRTVGTESRTTITQTNDTYQVVGNVTAVDTRTIAEAGLFDNVTGGNLFIRGNFTGVGVVVNDSIAFTFQFKLIPNAA